MSNISLPRPGWLITSAITAFITLSLHLFGQGAPAIRAGEINITGVPDDWTHHHVFFANPGTEQDAIQGGHYAQWQKIVNEPRYVIQELKKNLPVQGPAGIDVEYRRHWISDAGGASAGVGSQESEPTGFGDNARRGLPIRHKRWSSGPTSETKRDWSMTSGGKGGLLTNHYPAKYGSESPTVQSCSDYVVFPTGIVGSSTQATVIIYNNLYKTTCGSTVPGILLSINTGGLANTSPVLSLNGDQVAYVQTTSSGSLGGGGFTSGSSAFTVTSGLVAGDVGSIITASQSGIPAGTTIATVTSGTAGTLSASATRTRTGDTMTITGMAQLVLLKIGIGYDAGVGAPDSPAANTAANYRSCTGPCYTTFNFYNKTAGTPVPDTNSAPFYVYYGGTNGNTDTLYVGDDLGYLHEFNGVFAGTPSEETTGWPVAASTEAKPILNSPVYDGVSNDIFVGDASGFLHQIPAGASLTAPGTPVASGQLEYDSAGMDSVLVDDSSGTDYVYQFVGYSDDTADYRPSYINRFPATTTFTTGTADYGTSIYYPNGTKGVRPASAATIQRAGTFDNAYFTGNGTTGNIYGCADGVLYQIPLATITTPTVNTFSTPTTAAAECSGVTEFYNTTSSIDWLFMSVESSGKATGGSTCTGACVYNYNVSTSTNTTGSPVDGLTEAGGTSGIVIDNAATGGGSEIYFNSVSAETCLGNGTTGNGLGICAVQATQSALQ